jgi:hypothetical protein
MGKKKKKASSLDNCSLAELKQFYDNEISTINTIKAEIKQLANPPEFIDEDERLERSNIIARKEIVQKKHEERATIIALKVSEKSLKNQLNQASPAEDHEDSVIKRCIHVFLDTREPTSNQIAVAGSSGN